MDVTLVLLACSMFWKLSLSVRCYKCEPERTYDGSQTPMCQSFEDTQYVVDCKYSTMCFKKETLLVSLGVPTKSFQRGCASQIMDGEQEKVGRHYQHVKNIHEVYNEGCEEDYNGGKLTKTVHCYCRGDLCNGGNTSSFSLERSSVIFAVGISVLWLLIG